MRAAKLVNTDGQGFFTGYYNAEDATAERMRHGMYWSGGPGLPDADGWIYLAGRSGDWLRVDGENMAAAPIERILIRLPEVNLVAVYAVPDENVGDQIMAAIVLNDGATLTPESFESFLAAQPSTSPPRHGLGLRGSRASCRRPRRTRCSSAEVAGAGPNARRRWSSGSASRAAVAVPSAPRTRFVCNRVAVTARKMHTIARRLVLAQRPAEIGDRIPEIPRRAVERHRVLAGIGTRVPVLPGRAVDGLGAVPRRRAAVASCEDRSAESRPTIAGRSNS